MDERKGEHLKLAPPSLKAAVRRARVESAEQSEAVDDLRQAELARLEMLEEAIRPILDQAPEGVEVFDAGISHGERPRLFLDMISFVDLGHDRRTYRFFQDTRHGRVLIAESAEIDRIVAAMTNYIARRLVEREQSLSSDWRSRSAQAHTLKANARAKSLSQVARAARADAKATVVASAEAPEVKIGPRSGWDVAFELFNFILLILGSFTLLALICVGAWAGWNSWGRSAWAASFGAPPF